MTASRQTSATTAARYSQVNHQVDNNILVKRTRGPINKRACQRCRQGKIKCDGDAESGKPCSNCDPQHCKYDNSPRKNKQVEALKLRLSAVEEQLLLITRDVHDKLEIKDLEKEILCLLFESRDHFMQTKQNQDIFHQLKDALKQSRCFRPVLVITRELLMRLADASNESYIPEIMSSLQRFVECASSNGKDTSISSAEMCKKFEENFCPYPTNDNNMLPVDTMMIPLQSLDNTGTVHLNLDDASSTHSPNSNSNYDYDETVSAPNTPGHNQQQHPESKCFNGSNNVQHHIQNQGTSDYANPFPFNNDVNVNDMYPYYQNAPDYVNVNVNAVMENNYSSLYLVNEAPNTTSPTDEQAIPWVG